MADLNILDFYKDTALVLMSLQRVFPRKMDLFVEDLIGPDQVDEFGLHTKRHEACFGAMLWLADEGFHVLFGQRFERSDCCRELVAQGIERHRRRIIVAGLWLILRTFGIRCYVE